MRIAVMQPYFFPYIGYFQLINAVDKFVLLDDVSYIKKGWINRNRILVNNQDFTFTIPLRGVSQNKLINELLIVEEKKWKLKILKTIESSYKKAPQFKNVYPLLKEIINSNDLNLSRYILNSLRLLNNYLGITTQVIPGSSVYNNQALKAQMKIIDICLKEHANVYINSIGGSELYSKEDFSNAGIKIEFLKPTILEYSQFDNKFLPKLSIIDVMMFNSNEVLFNMIGKFDLNE